MPLPTDWDCQRDGPKRVACGRCREKHTEPTRVFRIGPTGTIDALYICNLCKWGTVLRYDPHLPDRYIRVSIITPGRGWKWVKPIPPAAKEK